MHKLLHRQLRRAFGDADGAPVDPAFLALVGQAYEQADTDRALLERSIALAGRELVERNRELRRELDERQKLELELRQAQKLEAVGQLAAGVAHEINTPIQYVGDSLHFLGDAFTEILGLLDEYRRIIGGCASHEAAAAAARAEAEADLDYLLGQIPRAMGRTRDGAARVAEIVRALKEFAHPGLPEQAPADLNRAISSTLTVARNELKYVADVETDLADLPPVVCKVDDINQVVLNLLVNAAHAIADAGAARGVIGIATRAEDGNAVITVSDSGCGIPPEIRPRIFDPFFTTKEVGRGSGQGLALVHAIVVERHGGAVHVESEVGRGTRFVVRLPVDGRSGR